MDQTTSVLARLSNILHVKAVFSNYRTAGQLEHTVTSWRSEAMPFRVCSARPKMRFGIVKASDICATESFSSSRVELEFSTKEKT